MERSALYFVFRALRGMYRANKVVKISHRRIDFGKEQWVAEPLSDTHEELTRENVVAYRQRLELLISKIKGVGGIPICVTQASAKSPTVAPRPSKDSAIPLVNSIPTASLTGIELTRGIAPFVAGLIGWGG